MVLFRQNLPQPTQAQLMRGEFPETLCIEQGVVLSCRFAEWRVRWTSRVLWMAVVSQSSENSSRQENRELPCREQHTLSILALIFAKTSDDCAGHCSCAAVATGCYLFYYVTLGANFFICNICFHGGILTLVRFFCSGSPGCWHCSIASSSLPAIAKLTPL